MRGNSQRQPGLLLWAAALRLSSKVDNRYQRKIIISGSADVLPCAEGLRFPAC